MLACRARAKHAPRTSVLSRRANARSYSNKVRAFPFVAPKEQAIAWLSCSAAALTGNKPVSTFLKYLFPSLDLDALRPVSVKPAYLPAWIVDAELEATIWAKKQVADNHFTKDTAQVQFAHTVVPGFDYRPLSSINFLTPELLEEKTIPWSEDLRKHGEDPVLCTPFTLTPFRLPEALRSLPVPQAGIAEVLRFEPPSVKETMMAAYPVLVPVYLAQYTAPAIVDNERKEVTVSAFIEAGVHNGRVGGEPVPMMKMFLELFGQGVPDLLVGGAQKQAVQRFAHVRSLTAHSTTLAHRTLVEERVNRALMSRNVLHRYQERFFPGGAKQAVDWTEARIRPFVTEERHANLQWLVSSADLYLLKTMLQVYNTRREGQQDGAPEVQEKEVEWVKTQIEKTEKTCEERKPAWLAAYELQERLLEPAPSEPASGEEQARHPTSEQQQPQ